MGEHSVECHSDREGKGNGAGPDSGLGRVRGREMRVGNVTQELNAVLVGQSILSQYYVTPKTHGKL